MQSEILPDALSQAPVQIRHLIKADLPLLEWDGQFTHFRRSFKNAYYNARKGLAVLWVAAIPPDRIVGQVFVSLISRARSELADGRRRAYLYSVRVRSEFRGQGLGSRLMDIAEADLVDRGYRISTLNVARDNPKAIRFYRSRGYQIMAPEPGQWSYIDHLGRRQHVNEPAWRMEKHL